MKYIPEKMTYKEYEESYTVRHIADTVGFMYLFMLILQYIWVFPIYKIIFSLGISLTNFDKYLNDPAIKLVVKVLLTAVIFTVPFITLCSRERQKPSAIIHYGAPKGRTFLPLVALGSSLCMLSNAATSILTQILEKIGIKGSNALDEVPQGLWGFALCVVALSFAPAILEEFAFRGVVLGLVRKTGEGFAIFVSAVMFSLMHLNIAQIPFAFFAGLIIGFVYLKSHSIWTAVAVHAISNFISICLNFGLDMVSKRMGDYISLGIIAASAVVALVSLLSYTKRGGNFKLCNSDYEISTKKKIGSFLKSPTIIVSLFATVILLLLT